MIIKNTFDYYHKESFVSKVKMILMIFVDIIKCKIKYLWRQLKTLKLHQSQHKMQIN